MAPPAAGETTPRCANCLEPLAGPFCSQCGQHVADYHRSVWRFVADFFDNFFCWDNKLFRTLGPLLKKPGWLTQEFMAGRRVRYVHPLRLFLFTSAVCLTLLQFNHAFEKTRKHSSRKIKPGVSVNFDQDEDEDADEDTRKPAASPSPTAGISSPAPAAGTAPATSPTSPANPVSPAPSASPTRGKGDKENADTLDQLLRDTLAAGFKEKDPKMDASLAKRWKTFEKNAKENSGEEKSLNEKVAENFQQKATWVALAMLPIFAWLMRFNYGQRGGYFFAYLVFSLHYHTFLLLFWTAFTWLATLVQATHLSVLAIPIIFGFLVPPWYLYLSLRLFYGESRARTASKTFAIGGLHLLAIVIGVAIAGVGGSLKVQ